jgi:proteasome lid subunit RPN8/RPN11
MFIEFSDFISLAEDTDEEICGIVLDDKILLTTNVAVNKQYQAEYPAEAMIFMDDHADEITGLIHSHLGSAQMSEQDKLAQKLFGYDFYIYSTTERKLEWYPNPNKKKKKHVLSRIIKD